MAEKMDLTGQRFGKLVVLGETDPLAYAPTATYPKGRTIRMWRCKCDCGNIYRAGTGELRRGDRKSCGCSGKRSHSRQLQEHCISCQHAMNGGNRKVFCEIHKKKLSNKDQLKLQNCPHKARRSDEIPGVFDDLGRFATVCMNCGEIFMADASTSPKSNGTEMYCPKCEAECRGANSRIIDKMTSQDYIKLAQAVIKQARVDYVEGELIARSGDSRGQTRHDSAAWFFKSEWFLVLTMLPEVNYNWLFKALDREIDHRWRNGQIRRDAEDIGDADWD